MNDDMMKDSMSMEALNAELPKCTCGHYHDGDVCDDCTCTIYHRQNDGDAIRCPECSASIVGANLAERFGTHLIKVHNYAPDTAERRVKEMNLG